MNKFLVIVLKMIKTFFLFDIFGNILDSFLTSDFLFPHIIVTTSLEVMKLHDVTQFLHFLVPIAFA